MERLSGLDRSSRWVGISTLILAYCVMTSVVAAAQKKPLPPALLNARVAFLTGQPRINPQLPPAEEALRKWARWELTYDSEVTDLILLITEKSDPDIFLNPAAAELARQYKPGVAVFLHVIDRTNGTVVWTEAIKGKMSDVSTGRKLVENLRKRLPKK